MFRTAQVPNVWHTIWKFLPVNTAIKNEKVDLFITNISKHIHQQKLDMAPRNYICNECGKDFKTSGELRGHKCYYGEKKLSGIYNRILKIQVLCLI